jgi:hypothetical protein
LIAVFHKPVGGLFEPVANPFDQSSGFHKPTAGAFGVIVGSFKAVDGSHKPVDGAFDAMCCSNIYTSGVFGLGGGSFDVSDKSFGVADSSFGPSAGAFGTAESLHFLDFPAFLRSSGQFDGFSSGRRAIFLFHPNGMKIIQPRVARHELP